MYYQRGDNNGREARLFMTGAARYVYPRAPRMDALHRAQNPRSILLKGGKIHTGAPIGGASGRRSAGPPRAGPIPRPMDVVGACRSWSGCRSVGGR